MTDIGREGRRVSFQMNADVILEGHYSSAKKHRYKHGSLVVVGGDGAGNEEGGDVGGLPPSAGGLVSRASAGSDSRGVQMVTPAPLVKPKPMAVPSAIMEDASLKATAEGEIDGAGVGERVNVLQC